MTLASNMSNGNPLPGMLPGMPEAAMPLPGMQSSACNVSPRPPPESSPRPPSESEPAGRRFLSQRFQCLLQELSDEHMAVTNALCEELRVARSGSQTGNGMSESLRVARSGCQAGNKLSEGSMASPIGDLALASCDDLQAARSANAAGAALPSMGLAGKAPLPPLPRISNISDAKTTNFSEGEQGMLSDESQGPTRISMTTHHEAPALLTDGNDCTSVDMPERLSLEELGGPFPALEGNADSTESRNRSSTRSQDVSASKRPGRKSLEFTASQSADTGLGASGGLSSFSRSQSVVFGERPTNKLKRSGSKALTRSMSMQALPASSRPSTMGILGPDKARRESRFAHRQSVHGVHRDLIVDILGASGLHVPSDKHDTDHFKHTHETEIHVAPDTFCTCHWKSHPSLQWRTPLARKTLDPEWNHCFVIKECRFGDELQFEVRLNNSDGPQSILGCATLPSSIFRLRGFEGTLLLESENSRAHAELLVKITVAGAMVSAKNPQLGSEIPIIDEGDGLDWKTWTWAQLVVSVLEATATELRKPRATWMKCSLGKDNKVHAKHMTGKLSEIESGFRHHLAVVPSRNAGYYEQNSLTQDLNKDTSCTAIDPHSPKRLLWAGIGMLFILYDIVMVPMQAFNMPDMIWIEIVKWAGQIFWTMDIVMNFFTAVYVQSQMNNNLGVVARVYATTWLPFDVLVTMPTYLPLIVGEDGEKQGVTQGIKIMRTLRLMRLLRLAKFRHLLAETLEVINSPSLLLGIGMMQNLFGLILWNHAVACIWFYVGSMNENGWAGRSKFQEGNIGYRYASALHWVLSQYQGTSEIVPGTLPERMYAVVFLQVAIIMLALFLSTLTNLMRQLQDLQSDNYKQQRSVRSYLNDNEISSGLSVRVKKYVDWQQTIEQKRRQDEKILLILPTSLLMDLMVEVRQPVISQHPFFNLFCSEYYRIARRICHEALFNINHAPGEMVFAPGDHCFCMYFVTRGHLNYVAKPQSLGTVLRTYQHDVPDIAEDIADGEMQKRLTPEEEAMEIISSQHLGESGAKNGVASNCERVRAGFWLSEAVLWTDWEHCGELLGLEECSLLCIEHASLTTIAATYKPALIMASIYARRFVVALQWFGRSFTDLIDNEVLFAHEAELEEETRASGTIHENSINHHHHHTGFAHRVSVMAREYAPNLFHAIEKHWDKHDNQQSPNCPRTTMKKQISKMSKLSVVTDHSTHPSSAKQGTFHKLV